jgi:uncharacterized protein
VKIREERDADAGVLARPAWQLEGHVLHDQAPRPDEHRPGAEAQNQQPENPQRERDEPSPQKDSRRTGKKFANGGATRHAGRMPAIPGLRVVASPIHGYGVVATRDFAVGEVIADVECILWREEEDRDDRYSLWLGEGYFLDMVDQTRWINHSCDPNGEVEADFAADGQHWARIVAIRPIVAGDEITFDYAFTAELAEPCVCGSAKCRGFIVDEEELHLLRSSAAPVLRSS